MEAIELTLKSGHLLKPSLTGQISLAPSGNNSANLNDSLRSNNSTLNLSTSTATVAKCSSKINISSKMQTSTTSLHTNNKEANDSCLNPFNQQQDTQDIESKHFKDMADVMDEERILPSDSENGKNNSSDEICSLNSSNDNLDDEYYDNGAAIVDQIFQTKTSNQVCGTCKDKGSIISYF